MAEFPITQARQELGFVPTTAVRADIDVRTGEGGAGTAIGQGILALGLRFELLEAKTQLSESAVAAADAQVEYFLGLESNEEPRTYNAELEKLFSSLDSLAPKNRRAAVIYNQKIANRKVSLALKTQKLAQKKQESKSQSADFLLLQKAKQTGDFVTYKASIINGVKLGIYDAKEGERLLDDADKERDEKEKTDTFGMALAQRDEEGVLINEKANEIINASALLDADEKNDLLNQITNRANQEKNRRDIQFRERMGDEAERLGKLLADGELIEQEMDEIDLGGVGEQKSQEEAFKRQWKTILRNTITRAEPLVSNGDVYDSLTTGSELVERGAKSPAEWETEFAEANADGLLTEDDRRTLRSKDIVATKTMQNRTFSQTTIDNRPILVELKDDELSGLVAARDNALQIKDLKTVNSLNFSIKKAQVQKWNFGRYRTALRSQIAQNPNWSQKQIFTASDILIGDFDKDEVELMKELEAANPDKSILRTPPDDEFKDIWPDLSIDDKAKIWELRMRGVPVETILGEIEE